MGKITTLNDIANNTMKIAKELNKEIFKNMLVVYNDDDWYVMSITKSSKLRLKNFKDDSIKFANIEDVVFYGDDNNVNYVKELVKLKKENSK